MGQTVFIFYFGLLLRGSSMIGLGLYCSPAILSPIYICTCPIRNQYDKTFPSLNPKYENHILFVHIWGYWGARMSNQCERKFKAVRPHHRADICVTREKHNHQFFIYGPQYYFFCIFGYSVGRWWPINNGTGPILLHSYPLTNIKLHIKYGSNPMSYREND